MPFTRDATLQKNIEDIANNANRLDICSDNPGPPTDLTNSLGHVALTVGDGNGSYVIADGNVSGRKLTVNAVDITASASGTGKHYVLSDGTTIYHTDTTADKSMASGLVYSFPTTDVTETRDPVSV